MCVSVSKLKRIYAEGNKMKEIIIATNETLRDLIMTEIKQHSNQCNLNHIDVSNVTDMRAMFYLTDFNGDISQWNTANVTDMSFMFSQSQFNGDISNWNTTKVTSMKWMFHSSPFNGDISNWVNKP